MIHFMNFNILIYNLKHYLIISYNKTIIYLPTLEFDVFCFKDCMFNLMESVAF